MAPQGGAAATCEAANARRLLSLRCDSDHVALHARGGHGLQLLALSSHRRIGGPWVYYEFGTVKIDGHPEATAEYIQGDRTLRTIRCRTCGCVTHSEPLAPAAGAKHGANLGNFDPALIASVKVRKFDGANTWKFFDEMERDSP